MSDTTKLKPCPFCGGEAYTYTAYNVSKGVRREYWLAHCKECGLNYPQHKKYCFSEEQAIKAWNTRAGEPKDEN